MKAYLLWMPIVGAMLIIAGSVLYSYTFSPLLLYLSFALAFCITLGWLILEWRSIKEFMFRRGTKYGAASGLVLLSGLMVFLALAILSNRDRFNKKIDMTNDRIYTLSSDTRKIIDFLKQKSLEKNLRVQVRVYTKDPNTYENIHKLLYLYKEAQANFDVEFLDPYINAVQAKADRITSGNSLILKFGEEQVIIQQFSEEKLTNALLFLLRPSSKNVCFVTTHGEPSIEGEGLNGLKKISEKIKSLRYNVFTIGLREYKDVEHCKLIFLVSPEYNLAFFETKILASFLQKGGSAFVLVDAMRPVDSLNGFLRPFGLEFNTDFIILSSDDQRISLFGQNAAIIDQFDLKHPITRPHSLNETVSLDIPESRSIIVNDAEKIASVNTAVLARTSPTNLQVSDIYTIDDLNEVESKHLRKLSAPFLVLSEDSTNNMRLLVAGSSQWITNQGMEKRSNSDLAINIINYLLRDENYIAITPKEDGSNGGLMLRSSFDAYALVLCCFLYPFSFLGVGLYFWVRRRRG